MTRRGKLMSGGAALVVALLVMVAAVVPYGINTSGAPVPADDIPAALLSGNVARARISSALAAGGDPVAGTTITGTTSVITPLINSATGFDLQYNGTSYLTLGSSSLLLGNAPLVRTPRTVTGNATLNAYDSVVLLNYTGAVSMTITLPTAPPDGTPITFIGTGTSNSSSGTTIQRGGSSDTIITAAATSIDMSIQGHNCTFIYDAARTKWWILGLQRRSIYFKFTSAAANDYLQPNNTGGVIGTAIPLYPTFGLTITTQISVYARSNPAANQTIKLRTVTTGYASAADLTNNFTVTMGSGSSTAFSGHIVNLISNGPFGGGFLVMQATTNITTEMEGWIEIYTL